jgi:hypothetical protein
MRFLLCLLLLIAVKISAFEITSFSRVFFDDNVFMRASATSDKTNTFYYSQSFSIKKDFFKETLSLQAAPEIRHRSVDDKTLFFGSANLKSKFELTPKLKIESKNSFSHSEREPSDLDDDLDVTYFMNKSSHEVMWHPRYLTKLKFKYENSIKRWSENLPIGSDSTNGDYSKNSYRLTVEQMIHKRFIFELIGENSQLDYNGTRGSLDNNTIFTQLSYVPNSFTIFKLNYGRIWSDIQNQNGNIREYSTPTYGANLTFFTPRGTVLGFNTVYEVMDSSIAYWNMKENLKTSVILKYPITPKLEISTMFAHLLTSYKDFGNRYEGVDLVRDEEVFVSSVTLSWRYNRNHYAEIGYQGLHLWNDAADVFKNKYFIGYRLAF